MNFGLAVVDSGLKRETAVGTKVSKHQGDLFVATGVNMLKNDLRIVTECGISVPEDIKARAGELVAEKGEWAWQLMKREAGLIGSMGIFSYAEFRNNPGN